MILETLFGAATGGIFSIISPIFGKLVDIWDRGRKHSESLELLKLRTELGIKEADAKAQVAELEGLYSHDRSLQGSQWVQTFRAFTRPGITWLFFFVYATIKVLGVYNGIVLGGDVVLSILDAWTGIDQALFTGVMVFWFGGRAIDKQLGK